MTAEEKAKRREWSRNYALRHPEITAERQRHHRLKVREYAERVKLMYGCQNPNCSWAGEWQGYMLDFDHIDPTDKKLSVSHAKSIRTARQEINKSRVLCACCHRAVTHGGLVLDPSIRCDEGDR